MMDVDDWLMLCLIWFGAVFVAMALVAGYIASGMGFTGIMWWAVTILFYIVIVGGIAMIKSICTR